MHFGGKQRIRFFVTLALIGVLGTASAAYLLDKQRFPRPFRDVYEVRAELIEADGVVAGLGQPVNVSGVKVGSITGTSHQQDGNALVTLEIERDRLPRVYADARVTLEPITPLKDMQIELDPGRPSAGRLREGATIDSARTSGPVPMANMLAALDYDTRAFLTSLISSLGEGTRGQGDNLRRALEALGPTTAQMGQISRALARRRVALARLVHNLSTVTRAASRDEQLASVIAAGNRTLEVLAEQEAPLRQSLARLPGTLETTRSTLVNAATFADRLRPTLRELTPAVRRLPATFGAMRRFTTSAIPAFARQIRPLVREAQPLLRALGPAVTAFSAAAPDLYRALQAQNYFFNEVAYNPPGNDEGFLFWLSYMGHNYNSAFSGGDAHGGLGRAMVLLNCQQTAAGADAGVLLKLATGSSNACPG